MLIYTFPYMAISDLSHRSEPLLLAGLGGVYGKPRTIHTLRSSPRTVVGLDEDFTAVAPLGGTTEKFAVHSTGTHRREWVAR